MTFSIDGDWIRKNGRRVDYIASPYTSGGFAMPPKITVMHFTYGGSARSSAEWFRSKDNPGSSAHCVIDRDGTVIQCVPLGSVAWHAGTSKWRELTGLNRHSIGIELANWGYLRRSEGGWRSYTGVVVADPVLAVHRNGNPDGSRQPIGWEPYSPPQMDAALGVMRAMRDALGIVEIVGHDDIAPTRKWDPGPAFDMVRFRNSVFGGRGDVGAATIKVAVSSGLNLRTGPGTQFAKIALLKNGTLLDPLGTDGAWIEVSALDDDGVPQQTGWVHSHYVSG